jgi:hypothetical protein
LITDFVLGIAPKQIAKHSFDGDLLKPIYLLYLLNLVEIGRNASMDGKVFLIDDSSHGEQIE